MSHFPTMLTSAAVNVLPWHEKVPRSTIALPQSNEFSELLGVESRNLRPNIGSWS
jgi:hypothetical protein